MSDLISVVMSVHDNERTVGAAIESILQQTYSDLELILVDDGSRDGTFAVLESYARQDRRLRLIRNDRNRGIAYSLNIGWRGARGELIARMDGDDLSFPERLFEQHAFMKSHPEIAVLGTGVKTVAADGTELGVLLLPENHFDLAKDVYHVTPFIHPTVLMRRNFLESTGGYAEQWRRAEDSELWIRGVRTHRFHNLQQPLVRYTLRRNQTLGEIIERTHMLAHAVHRDRLWLTHGHHVLRFLVAGLRTATLYPSRRASLS